MRNHIGRREFINVLGGAGATWSLAAGAQQPAMPVIGYLDPGAAEARADLVVAFRKGLSETGYVEGRNVAIEYRWAEGQSDRYPALAADLVRRQASVIAAVGSSPAALAAKGATTTIPIVFQTGRDPVKDGLVASMNRPVGNVTGVTRLSFTMGPKRLELLHEAVPNATAIGFLVNPTNLSLAEPSTRDMQAAAATLGLQLLVLNAGSERELETAFAELVQRGAGALLTDLDLFFYGRRGQLAALAARHAIPVMNGEREMTVAGGLMSYAASLTDSYRQAGVYVGRILKGARPADLPVLQPTVFEFVINLKTAKALGLDLPLKLHAFATEVIE
jgi:putative tryptophan/tyrosine transport system substrate-binding protein